MVSRLECREVPALEPGNRRGRHARSPGEIDLAQAASKSNSPERAADPLVIHRPSVARPAYLRLTRLSSQTCAARTLAAIRGESARAGVREHSPNARLGARFAPPTAANGLPAQVWTNRHGCSIMAIDPQPIHTPRRPLHIDPGTGPHTNADLSTHERHSSTPPSTPKPQHLAVCPQKQPLHLVFFA